MQNKRDTKLVCLTAYTAPVARLLAPHCDLLLVGDSVAMVLYGEETTRKASLEMMIRHGQAVVRSAGDNCKVIVDMPYGTYEDSDNQALENAKAIREKTGCYGVKLEGGVAMEGRIRTLSEHSIPVMGHIGLLPQSVDSPDGFKMQGRGEEAAKILMEDARAVERAGAFCFVIEAVPPEVGANITRNVSIPTIGIGAGPDCDGQILVSEDMLGLNGAGVPKFVKQFSRLDQEIDKAVAAYAQQVRNGDFPAVEQTYRSKTKHEAA